MKIPDEQVKGYKPAEPPGRIFGDHPVEEPASHAASGEPPVEDAVAAVAERVQELAVDNGQTAFAADTGTVLWVSSDSTGTDELAQAREAFLAVDGVEDFVSESEAMPSGWCEAEIVYGGDPFAGACEEQMALEVVSLAAAPLDLPAVEPVWETETQSDPWLDRALETIADAHRATVSAVGEALTASAQKRDDGRDDLALAAVEALARFAARPADPSPIVNVHVPKQDLSVHVDGPTVTPQIDVHVPEPVVHIAAAAPEPRAEIHVHVPEQPAPTVEMHTHVEPTPVEVHNHVERAKPVAVRVERDSDGTTVYVPEEMEES